MKMASDYRKKGSIFGNVPGVPPPPNPSVVGDTRTIPSLHLFQRFSRKIDFENVMKIISGCTRLQEIGFCFPFSKEPSRF